MHRLCRVGSSNLPITIGPDRPLTVIAGPCVLESETLCLEVGQVMAEACARAGLPYIFKASFDKANRSSAGSARGPGVKEGVRALASVREKLGVPVTTDVHLPEQAEEVAAVADLLQIPAFLCRQTDLLVACGEAAARHKRAVNVKKGQFMAPSEMVGPIEKLSRAGCHNVIVTERGTFFGYHRLVNDFSGVVDLMELLGEQTPPVCFDATHSTQLPGGGAGVTSGRPDRAAPLARAAVAVGVHAVFLECHPEPSRALSDAATSLPLAEAVELVGALARLRTSAHPV